jgi:hypothetical protein
MPLGVGVVGGDLPKTDALGRVTIGREQREVISNDF